MTADRLLVACKRSLLSCPAETSNTLATHLSACETCDGADRRDSFRIPMLCTWRFCHHLPEPCRENIRENKTGRTGVNHGQLRLLGRRHVRRSRSRLVTPGHFRITPWVELGVKRPEVQILSARLGKGRCHEHRPLLFARDSAIDSCCIVLSSTYLLRRVGPRPAERRASVSKATVSAHGSGGRCD